MGYDKRHHLDNSVTVADATLLQKYVVGIATLTDDQKLLADCNGDGVLMFEMLHTFRKLL